MIIENTVHKDHKLYKISKQVESFLKSVIAFDGYEIRIREHQLTCSIKCEKFNNDYYFRGNGNKSSYWAWIQNTADSVGGSGSCHNSPDIGYFIQQMEAG